MQNARPFDPNDRPRKGEWIVINDSSAGTALTNPVFGGSSANNDSQYGSTMADAGTYQPSAPYSPPAANSIQVQKSGPNIVLIIVGVVVLGLIGVGAMMVMRPKGQANTPTKVSSNGGTTSSGTEDPAPVSSGTSQESEEGRPSLGKTIKKESETAKSLVLTVTYDLAKEGARLDKKNPIEYEHAGGKIDSIAVNGDTITIKITKTGTGYLRIEGLNQDQSSDVNLNGEIKSRSVAWTVPTAAPTATARPGGGVRPKIGSGSRPGAGSGRPAIRPDGNRPGPVGGGSGAGTGTGGGVSEKDN